MDIELLQFARFFTTLSQLYLQLDDHERVKLCHQLIVMRTNSHLAACNRNSRCGYYDIGISYYHVGQYQNAAEFLERALNGLNLASKVMDRVKIMIQLINT